MRLATWNVNSIRVRAAQVAAWLEREAPDILCLQEIKCEEPGFPRAPFEALGYRVEAVGQKTYNGVAVLARIPVTITCRALPGLPEGDAQARYLEVEAGDLVIGNLYLPNGNSGGEAGFRYKLEWMRRLRARAEGHLRADRDLALLGDFNLCPAALDMAEDLLAPTDALRHPKSRAEYRALIWLGLLDAHRALRPSGREYSFWDYTNNAWPRNRGLRIDHVLLSARPAERLRDLWLCREERDAAQPSDHVPVMAELS